MAMKTYHGSCVCGKVMFEASFDIAAGTFKCNCTVCLKGRFWGASAKGADVHITHGQKDVTLFGEHIHYHFCKHCGTRLFGKSGEKVAINLGTLDDLDPKEWAAAPVKYVNGRYDDWKNEPEFKGHL